MSTFGREYDEAQQQPSLEGAELQAKHRAHGKWRAYSPEPSLTTIKIIPFEKIKLEENHRPYRSNSGKGANSGLGSA